MILRLLDLLVERRLILWILASASLAVSSRSSKHSSWVRYRRVMLVVAVVLGIVWQWVRAQVLRRTAPPPAPAPPAGTMLSAPHPATVCASLPRDDAMHQIHVLPPPTDITPGKSRDTEQGSVEEQPTLRAVVAEPCPCTPNNKPAQPSSASISPQIVLPPLLHHKRGHPLHHDDLTASPQHSSVGGRSIDRTADMDEVCGTSSVDLLHSGSDCDLGDDEEELLAASVSYNVKYQQLMMQMQKPDVSERPRPFLGFSLAESVEDRNLVVDGVYHDGPAYQVGVRIDDELTCIAGDVVSSIQEARRLVAKHCRPAMLSDLTFRRPNGESYTVKLWVMTSEPRYRGKAYFFDTDMHVKQQHPPRSARARGASLRSFVAAQQQ